MLDGLEHPQGLVNRAAKGKVVDGRVLDDTLPVDNEQPTQSDSVIGQDVVGGRDLLLEIGDKAVVDVANATLIPRGLDPRQVAELRVDGHAQDLAVEGLELLVAVREAGNLRRANEGEVERVEEQHQVLSAVVGEALGDKLLIQNHLGGEIRGDVANKRLGVL